jgi:hypothetical protein
MIRKSVFLTAAVICAVVFTGTTPAQAADESAIKRAIVVTVLNNLGVQPTDELVNDIVGEIPMEFFDSTLVREVGTALDDSEDPTLIISQTVDSDGDGVPNADATVDSDEESDDDADEADDDSSGSSGSSGSDDDTSGSSGSSGSDDDSNDDADDDSDEDEEDGDDDDN